MTIILIVIFTAEKQYQICVSRHAMKLIVRLFVRQTPAQKHTLSMFPLFKGKLPPSRVYVEEGNKEGRKD